MIRIVNKHWHQPTPNDCYCARGSVLGNPYSHMDGTKAQFKVATRAEAIERYLPWFEKERMNNPFVHQLLTEMKCQVLDGKDLNLVCYCAPADCHCRHIKEYLEETISNIKIE